MTTERSATVSAAPIAGAPNTPRWLQIRTWRTARALGDPHPSKIVVHLRVRERGRVVDRVWMRGNFVCADCSHGPSNAPAPHGHLVGFIVDDSTHQTISFSISRG